MKSWQPKGISEAEKVAVTAACQRLIDEVLKPRFLPVIRPTQFNYPVDIHGKWRGCELPRSTVDWDTSQADDFRTRGEPWTIKRTRLERGQTRRSERQGLARWRSGVAAGCHASARLRQCCGCCAGKTWKLSHASWASRQRR